MEKVKLNQDMCIGCGACTGIAPKNFDFGETHANLISDEVTPEAKEASDCCPVGAITIENGAAVVNADSCIDCGACEGACPTGAIAAE